MKKSTMLINYCYKEYPRHHSSNTQNWMAEHQTLNGSFIKILIKFLKLTIVLLSAHGIAKHILYIQNFSLITWPKCAFQQQKRVNSSLPINILLSFKWFSGLSLLDNLTVNCMSINQQCMSLNSIASLSNN